MTDKADSAKSVQLQHLPDVIRLHTLLWSLNGQSVMIFVILSVTNSQQSQSQCLDLQPFIVQFVSGGLSLDDGAGFEGRQTYGNGKPGECPF